MLGSAQLAVLAALEQRKLLVCVGPLVAMAAGLPGPRALVERCFEALDAGSAGDPVFRDGGVARALEHAEAALGSAKFVRLVRAIWETPTGVPAVAQTLVDLSHGLNSIVTTNLDRVLERAFAGQWHAVDESAPDIAKRTKAIFKVRGTIDRPTGWMLTERQYDNASFFAPGLRRELAALLRSHVVLFVGFTPDDEDLLHLLAVRAHPIADERRSGSETAIPDVMLAPSAADDPRDWLGQAGIELISISGDYDLGAAAWLRAVADAFARPTHTSATSPLESTAPDAQPYPGLEPFTETNRRFFFGREDDLERVIRRLGSVTTPLRQWLHLDGPSGVGKSSFLLAGLVPALRDGATPISGVQHRWRVVTMRPGLAPVFELAEQLQRAIFREPNASASAFGARMQHATPVLGEFLASHLAADEGLLLVVDQLEEALLAPRVEVREAFAAALAELLVRSPRPLLLVTSLRSDFSGDLPRLPALHERLTGTSPPVRYTLAALSAAQLAAAIEDPAREAGLLLDPGLTERVLADAGQIERGDEAPRDDPPEQVLPLVAAVMASLHERRLGRRLTHAAYAELGGLAGALTRRADAALAPLLRDFSEDQVWALFRRLVVTESQGRATRRTLHRPDALAAAGGGPRAESLLAHLTGARGAMRLVVLHGNGAGARVDLVHEALLRGWPWLRERIERDRAELIRESELTRAAELWERLGRQRSDLPRGAEASYFLHANAAEDTVARDYQDAVRAHLRRHRWRIGAVIAALVGIAVILAGLYLYAERQRVTAEDAANGERAAADEARKRTAHAREALLMASARQLLPNRDPTRASRLVVEIGDLTATSEWLALAYDVAAQRLARHVLRGHTATVRRVSFSPNGRRILSVSADGTARVWDLRTGRFELRLTQPGPIVSAEFSPDSELVVTASADRTARVWDLAMDKFFMLEGHDGPVRSAEFSHDGKRVVTASVDGTACVWDLATRQPVELSGHLGAVTSASFSRDGKFVVTVSDDHTARVWDVRTARSFPLKGHGTPVLAAEFSPDGTHVLTVARDDPTPLLWNIRTRRSRKLTGHQETVTSARFNRDGTQILTGSWDGHARLWNLRTGQSSELRGPGHASAIVAVAFSPVGARAVTASWDRTARVWDLDSDSPRARPPVLLAGHTYALESATFSPDGRYVVTASEDLTVRVWDLNTEASLELAGSPNMITVAAFSPDGRSVLTAAGSEARVWDAATRKFVTLSGHDLPVRTARFSVDGRRIVTASRDTTARVWDPDTGESMLKLPHPAPVVSAEFNRSGTHIVTTSQDMKARVWDVNTGHARELEGHTAMIGSAKFSPDGIRVIASDDRTARVWNLQTLGPITLDGHRDAVHSAEFSPDGARFLTASRDRVRVWNLATLQPTELDDPSESVVTASFSPDSNHVVTASEDRTARVWNLASGTRIELRDHSSWIVSAAFNADGTRLVTGSADTTARVWDLATGQSIELRAHTRALSAAVFSPDGKFVLTASDDWTARIWPLDPATLRTHLRDASTECLLVEDRVRFLAETRADALAAAAHCRNTQP